ncbi:GGDEF domain-containing protein [Maridesulfovibrio ferrireducens]|uniref:GGDEF domain-containing protein n=1 Tax=Maridesulfovibrio ferrireducens TaxID=246191 RepID=UPI001A28F8FA|nr:GGDEF domain-containing protein [Maridesulfovibrio ferrireducens]MBI9110512.1 GGDEF domain-containing protein [Maridesulfovibrio ferrireducens]
MKNNSSIGFPRLVILPIIFILTVSAIFLFHTIIVEQQRLNNVKQCLEDIRSDAYRIAGKNITTRTSYEAERLSNLIKKLKDIKKDNSFYTVINANNKKLINLAENFLKASINPQDIQPEQSILYLTNSLDEVIINTLVNIDKEYKASLRDTIKMEYSIIILICIFIVLQYFIADAYMKRRLIQQELEHQESESIIKKLSERDTLTNLPGRKKFYEEADREIATATRYSSDLVLIKMDIHDFKGINQKYGQKAGDKILARFARMVRKNLRRPDSFFRVGGDKFVILAPHTSSENAQKLAEKINLLVKKDKTTSSISLKINTGIAPCVKGCSSETLMKEASSALKSSKIRGAGKVAVYEKSEN